MKPSDVRAYLERDWDAARALKDRYWADAKQKLGPEEVLAIGDNLRQHALQLRTDWPDARERRLDLETHTRVSELLRRAPSSFRR